jgi:hypothetical protein
MSESTIPDGLTCGDCQRYPKCNALIGVNRNATECDYFPVNFVASSVLFAAYKRDVLQLRTENDQLRADLDKLKFHLHGIFWEASNAIGDTPKSNRAVGVIATTCHKLITESYLVREKISMDHAEGKQRWTAHLSLENLTQEQVNALTLQIVEWVEAEGGFVAGGFALEANDEKEPGTDQNQ